jgi:TonB family protein
MSRPRLLRALVAVLLFTVVLVGIKFFIVGQGGIQKAVATSYKDNVTPHVIFREEPRYSEEALRARVNASVAVSGKVNAAGFPEDIRVVHTAGFGLDEAALAACEHWRFAPAEKNGRPITMGFGTTLVFRIPEQGIPTATLGFDLPSGAKRPVLEKGNLSGLTLPQTGISVEFDVDQQGQVGHIASPSAALGERLSHWQFTPATLNGVPTRTRAKLTLFGGY